MERPISINPLLKKKKHTLLILIFPLLPRSVLFSGHFMHVNVALVSWTTRVTLQGQWKYSVHQTECKWKYWMRPSPRECFLFYNEFYVCFLCRRLISSERSYCSCSIKGWSLWQTEKLLFAVVHVSCFNMLFFFFF